MTKDFYNAVNTLKNSGSNALIFRLTKEIEALKRQFDDTDYKTMKNIQYERMGKELPYKWEDIDAKAEHIRVQINEKEKQISNLTGMR